jgi:hypothetical protein
MSLVRKEHPDVVGAEELDPRWVQDVAELDVPYPPLPEDGPLREFRHSVMESID